MKELPEGVDTVMFLRDGWPNTNVCKVKMKDGCVGIGIARFHPIDGDISPEQFDEKAFHDAMASVGDAPPDYSLLNDYVQRQIEEAAARSQKAT
jgi:hypothetical protein